MNSVNGIKHRFERGRPLDFIFFWGAHEKPYGVFCQWYESPFVMDGILYNTAEQAMMAEKARLFDDKQTLLRIMDEGRDPRIAKHLGRQVQCFNSEVWDAAKFGIVVRINYAKFTQDESLKKIILDTQNKILVEASPFDQIWGIGLKAEDKDSRIPTKWKGLNLLGEALMNVRDVIMDEETCGD